VSKEFDQFADGYDAAMNNPLKRISGKNQDDFLRPKIRKMLDFLGDRSSPTRLLDFGCGTGDFLRLLHEERPDWTLDGVDISPGMVDEARRRLQSHQIKDIQLYVSETLEGLKDYDIATASCVFHHIPPSEWLANFEKIYHVLGNGGLLFLFEHNPWNPATQLIVKTAEIDKHAILMPSSLSRQCIQKAGFSILNLSYFLYLPPRLPFAAQADHLLGHLPFGAQYFIAALR